MTAISTRAAVELAFTRAAPDINGNSIFFITLDAITAATGCTAADAIKAARKNGARVTSRAGAVAFRFQVSGGLIPDLSARLSRSVADAILARDLRALDKFINSVTWEAL